MNHYFLASLILAFTTFTQGNQVTESRKEGPRIQIALLLDTSGSMNGLIDQAKSQLWSIVNDMALAKKRGLTPRLEVALFEYGKSSLAASEGYLQMLVPLTRDLDRLSEALFALQTNGGDEYCGQVIGKATQNLNWSENNGDYKAIFIAGNEPFNQGTVDFRTTCAQAISKGIVVNTIFCGNEAEGIRTHWKTGADLADGKFAVIDHNQQRMAVKAPQDEKILQLGQQLNQTYLAFGHGGKTAQKRQRVQDQQASAMAEEVAVERVMTKASSAYRAAEWDLVEAVQEGEVSVADVPSQQLPEPMQSMNDDEKEAYVKAKTKEREAIQRELKQLQEDRRKYVASVRKDQDTLDSVMVKAIRQQMKARQFQF